MYLKITSALLIVTSMFILHGCSTSKGGGFNLFTVEQDIELGKQVSQQIADDPAQFPVLKKQGNEQVYAYIQKITNKILNSGKIQHRDDFAWEVKIIDDNETLNAFATPGGYIYVYTGLIKYLDTEDQLAGVMGHEIAHSDLRHSTRQMTKIYGLSALTAIATGSAEPGMIEQIALGLISLKFSRNHEIEADEHSVIYLCETDYDPTGAAGFFEKIQSGGSGQSTPEFLSTHPDPGNRVGSINGKAQDLGCRAKKTNPTEHDRIKGLL